MRPHLWGRLEAVSTAKLLSFFPCTQWACNGVEFDGERCCHKTLWRGNPFFVLRDCRRMSVLNSLCIFLLCRPLQHCHYWRWPGGRPWLCRGRCQSCLYLIGRKRCCLQVQPLSQSLRAFLGVRGGTELNHPCDMTLRIGMSPPE